MANVSDTTKWGIGIILTLLIQTFAVGWYMSNLNAQVQQNTKDITDLKSGANVYLTRIQLEDILGARDQKITNIEASVSRIEKKLDQFLGK